MPIDRAERSPEQHARWILAHILDWHRREDKAAWWEYFRLKALSADELLDERAALSGLTYVGSVGGTVKAPIHRYRFPAQETELRGDEDLRQLGGDRFGKVESISLDDRTVDIKKRRDTANVHPEAVFAHQMVDAQVLADALVRIGEYVADHGLIGDGPYQAARDLLLVIAPRMGGEPLKEIDETNLAAAMRIAPQFRGVLPIQGPPGAGKTHIGARMICKLAQAGRSVGITLAQDFMLLNRREFNGLCAALGSLVIPQRAWAVDGGASSGPRPTVKFHDGTVVPALGQGSAGLAQGAHPRAVEEEALRTAFPSA